MTTRIPKRLLSDKRANVGVLFGLLALPAFGLMGAAIDTGRWVSAQFETKKAMDAAVIAGVGALRDGKAPGEAVAIAREYYASNVASRVPLLTDTIDFAVDPDGTRITSTGNASLATTILKLVGVDELPLVTTANSGYSAAEFVAGGGGGNLEISVMLDVTGSMCDDGYGPCTSSVKLDALKDAARELVNTVVWENQEDYTSKVALVPFSTRVRLEPDGQGGDLMKAVTDLDATWSGWYKTCTSSSGGGGSEGAGNWQCHQYQAQWKNNWKVMPCVTDRFYNNGWHYDDTDDAPGSGKYFNAHDGGRMVKSRDSANTPDNSKNGKTKNKAADHWNFAPWGGGGQCADIGNGNQLMPLTNDKTALLGRIDSLEAFGATAGALGTSFAWNTLSPKWKNIWPSASEPRPYSDLTETNEHGIPKVRKVAILMTDGVYNTYRSWKGQDQNYVSGFATQLCTNMKNAGIEIYTVGFALDELVGSEKTIAENTLMSCGSSIDHFYNTLDVDQLKQAFKDIAIKVSSQIALTE